ncbi:hypothetical protein RJT34_09983 [Clitoria ternatea]|uniref:Uncharacterized protein n=1 Tax=Clitoria ternatea TaxID=43366 RepID=A0AAN9PTK5_CLITE
MSFIFLWIRYYYFCWLCGRPCCFAAFDNLKDEKYIFIIVRIAIDSVKLVDEQKWKGGFDEMFYIDFTI